MKNSDEWCLSGVEKRNLELYEVARTLLRLPHSHMGLSENSRKNTIPSIG